MLAKVQVVVVTPTEYWLKRRSGEGARVENLMECFDLERSALGLREFVALFELILAGLGSIQIGHKA